MICIGLNYLKHVAEGSYRDQDLPEHPTLFARWTRIADRGRRRGAGPVERGRPGLGGRDRRLGRRAAGRRHPGRGAGRRRRLLDVQRPHLAPRAEAHLASGSSARTATAPARSARWCRRAEVGDLRDGLRVQTRVNGETVQDGTTDQMVYTVGDTLSLISHTFTLRPGDLLATGTPSGVGYARTPAVAAAARRRRRGRGRAARRAAQHRRRQRARHAADAARPPAPPASRGLA